MTRWNVGSDSASPGGSAHPGCIATMDTPATVGPPGPTGPPPRRADPPAEAPCPLPHQGGLRPLRAGVRHRARVPTGPPLEVVEVQPLGVHAARRDGDHARAGRPPQQREQACDEGERTDHQHRQRRLDPVRTLGPLGEDRPGVVDHDVEARLGRDDAGGGVTDRRERAHVHDDDRELIAAVRLDELVAQTVEPLPAAPGEDDPGAQGRQGAGRRQAEPRRRPVTRTVRPSSAPSRGGAQP